jgi:predicted GNAT family acetyltransferase
MSNIAIRKIDELIVDEIDHLIEESTQNGFQFMRRLKDEYRNGLNRFDKDGEALYTAQCDNLIVGICGINSDPYLNDPTIGRVRHLYVARACRNQGIASSLINKIIHDTSKNYKLLVLRTDNPVADKLYRELGFTESSFRNASHQFNL